MPDPKPLQPSAILTGADTPEARSAGATLFAATIAAHGGDAFLNVRTLKLTGRGQFTTPPQTGGLTVPLASFTYWVAAGGRSRLEARSPGGPMLFVIHGHGKGGFIRMAGRTQVLPPDQTDGIEVTELLRLTARARHPVISVTDAPLHPTDDGKTLRRYDIHDEHGRIRSLFVESDTGRVRKVVSNNTRGEVAILLSHYIVTSGLPIATEMQMRENGANVIKLTASNVTIDEDVKDSLFEAP